MRVAVYPGSFDPFTLGHLDILKAAAPMFDSVCVAVLNNPLKQAYFPAQERISLIEAAVADCGLQNVTMGSFEGLLVDFAASIGAEYIVRGLRSTMDFEYEVQMNAMNRRLDPKISTVYFMANTEYAFLSSSIVREVGSLGGCIDGLVPEINKKLIAERLIKR